MNTEKRSQRGFASMSKERQREIASRGGKAAHERGTAHEFSPVEASMAARIGHERGTAHEFTTEEARLAGRKGGLARARKRSNGAANGAANGTASGNGNGHGHGNGLGAGNHGGEGINGTTPSADAGVEVGVSNEREFAGADIGNGNNPSTVD